MKNPLYYILVFIFFNINIYSQDGCLYISEVMLDPIGGECSGSGVGQEYVTITNGGNSSIDLTGWHIVEWDEGIVNNMLVNGPGANFSLTTNSEGYTSLAPAQSITIFFCSDSTNCVMCSHDPNGFANLNNVLGDDVYLFSPSQTVPGPSLGNFNPVESTYTSHLSAPSTTLEGELVTQNAPTSCSTMPADLLSFSIQNINKEVLIKWTTTNEINCDYYGIEKSTDSKVWKEISRISAVRSLEANKYTYIDEGLRGNKTYYRLKQVDLDGEYSISKILSIKSLKDLNNISIYPNPVDNTLFFKSETLVEKAVIYDFTGQLIIEVNDITENQIDLSNLTEGVYFIRLYKYGSINSFKLFKL